MTLDPQKIRDDIGISATNVLNDLFDVDTTGQVLDSFLKFDGSKWVVYNLFSSTNTWTADQTFTNAIIMSANNSIRFDNNPLMFILGNNSVMTLQALTQISLGSPIVKQSTTEATATSSFKAGGVTGSFKWVGADDRFEFEDDMVFSATSGAGILNETPSVTNPSIVPNKDDPDTGIGWRSANSLPIVCGGVEVARFGSAGNIICTVEGAKFRGGNSNSGVMMNEASSATNPTLIPNRANETAGIGGASGEVDLITNSISRLNINSSGDILANSDVGSGSLLFTRSDGRILFTLSDVASAKGFKINKTESVKPTSSPEYFDLSLTRTWDDTGSLVSLMNINVTDNHDVATGGPPHLTNIFNLAYSRSGSESATANLPTAFKIAMSDTGTYTSSAQMTAAFLEMIGNLVGSNNTASNITAQITALDFSSRVEPTNSGAGTATGVSRVVFWDSQYSQIGTDIINATGIILKPNIFQVGASPTYNFLGFEAIPSFQFDQGGTLTSVGFNYNPSGASVGNATHKAFISTRGDWFNQSDSGRHFFGADDDADIGHDGSNMLYKCTTGLNKFDKDIEVPLETYDATNWNGNSECATKNDVRDKIETISGGHGTGFVSITTTKDSDSQTAEFNVFDQDNYTAYTFTPNVTQNNMTYVQSTGRFTATNAGTYKITWVQYYEVRDSEGMNFHIKKNGSTTLYSKMHLYTASWTSSNCDNHIRTVTIDILTTLAANDYIEFLLLAKTTTCMNEHQWFSKDGTTASIHKVAD